MPVQSQRWDDFSDGLNTKASADQLPASASPDMQDCFIGQSGEIIQRNGYAKYDSSSLAATIRRIYDYQTSGGTQRLVVHAGTDIKKWDNPGWSSALVSSAGTQPISCLTFHDFLWMTNGTISKRYDGTNVRQWGITAPASTCSTAAGAAGVLSGLYQYMVTYVRGGTYGAESNASSASTALSVSSKQIDLTSIPTSSDGQVTARNIYRTASNGGTYYYLTQIANNTATTYTDNTADTSLDTTRKAPQSTESGALDHSVPPAARYAALYKNRIWLGIHNTRTLRFSDLDNPDYFPAAYSISLPTNDADTIQGMVSLYDSLYVWTQDSIQVITGGYNTTGFSRNKVTGAHGCIAGESITSTGQFVFYLAEDGVYVFNGETPELISLQISPTLDSISIANRQAAVGAYFASPATSNTSSPMQQYWLTIPGAGKVFIYDLVKQYWTVYSMTMNTLGTFEDATSDKTVLLGGNATYVWQMDSGLTDDGTAISWYWKSPWVTLGGEEWRKDIRRGYVTSQGSGSYTLTVDAYADFSGTATQTATLTLGANRSCQRVDMHVHGQWFQFKLSGNGSTGGPVKIAALQWFVDPLRRV